MQIYTSVQFMVLICAVLTAHLSGGANSAPQASRLDFGERERKGVKGKVFPYSLPSVRPGADPGVQAVSPQVT